MTKTVLIIEDSATMRRLIRLVLSLENLEFVEEHNAEDGVKAALHYKPDLIIADEGLNGESATAVCRKLKRDLGLLFPFVVLTGNIKGYNHFKGVEAGVDEVIAKPFESDNFITRIRGLIDGISGTKAVPGRKGSIPGLRDYDPEETDPYGIPLAKVIDEPEDLGSSEVEIASDMRINHDVFESIEVNNHITLPYEDPISTFLSDADDVSTRQAADEPEQSEAIDYQVHAEDLSADPENADRNEPIPDPELPVAPDPRMDDEDDAEGESDADLAGDDSPEARPDEQDDSVEDDPTGAAGWESDEDDSSAGEPEAAESEAELETARPAPVVDFAINGSPMVRAMLHQPTSPNLADEDLEKLVSLDIRRRLSKIKLEDLDKEIKKILVRGIEQTVEKMLPQIKTEIVLTVVKMLKDK